MRSNNRRRTFERPSGLFGYTSGDESSDSIGHPEPEAAHDIEDLGACEFDFDNLRPFKKVDDSEDEETMNGMTEEQKEQMFDELDAMLLSDRSPDVRANSEGSHMAEDERHRSTAKFRQNFEAEGCRIQKASEESYSEIRTVYLEKDISPAVKGAPLAENTLSRTDDLAADVDPFAEMMEEEMSSVPVLAFAESLTPPPPKPSPKPPIRDFLGLAESLTPPRVRVSPEPPMAVPATRYQAEDPFGEMMEQEYACVHSDALPRGSETGVNSGAWLPATHLQSESLMASPEISAPPSPREEFDSAWHHPHEEPADETQNDAPMTIFTRNELLSYYTVLSAMREAGTIDDPSAKFITTEEAPPRDPKRPKNAKSSVHPGAMDGAHPIRAKKGKKAKESKDWDTMRANVVDELAGTLESADCEQPVLVEGQPNRYVISTNPLVFAQVDPQKHRSMPEGGIGAVWIALQDMIVHAGDSSLSPAVAQLRHGQRCRQLEAHFIGTSTARMRVTVDDEALFHEVASGFLIITLSELSSIALITMPSNATTLDVAASSQEPFPRIESGLPDGAIGATWIVLVRELVVRAGNTQDEDGCFINDRVGKLKQGALCVQLVPWIRRADGIVRMHIHAEQDGLPIDGWASLDARDCRDSKGEAGPLFMGLALV